MKLTDDQLEQFSRDGFLMLPELFSHEEIEAIRVELPTLFDEETQANIPEKEGGAVRTIMGLHQRNALFGRLVRPSPTCWAGATNCWAGALCSAGKSQC